MTYDQLLTLESIVNYGSFKAAAEFLNKSQPSLSVAIKKLEESFQIKIFDRSNYRPALTHEGQLFYDKAKLALEHMRALQLFGNELSMGIEGEIRIGLDSLFPIDSILDSLKNFFHEYNSTNLTLVMGNVRGTYSKLVNDKIDFGFTPLIEIDDFSQFDAFVVFKTQMIPICTPELYKIVNKNMNLLIKYPQVIVTDSGPDKDKNFGVVDGARKWVVSDVNTKKKIISKGFGWGSLPEFMIKEELQNKELVTLDFNHFTPAELNIYIAKKRNKALGPISQKLWEQFMDKRI